MSVALGFFPIKRHDILLIITGYVGSLGDKPKRTMVEIKGRFSVTSENLDLAKVGCPPLTEQDHFKQII
jgi:hypothetical protein